MTDSNHNLHATLTDVQVFRWLLTVDVLIGWNVSCRKPQGFADCRGHVAIMVQKDTELNDLSGLRIDGMQL